ncbi:hypothetical protein XSR1_30056 [Xenorhabdus szentirmaii DSM 16338]|uniref:Uncharacterized protein n=1 Tax=Xenorhabdus szentirmaii DSM 16338 TaxID=1427518 RepID=W1IZZ3_9GAMM|nr:hypothetical protein XSR1_30056 [Xenorhabdus szentirmaii DSM 16338]
MVHFCCCDGSNSCFGIKTGRHNSDAPVLDIYQNKDDIEMMDHITPIQEGKRLRCLI